MEDNKQEEIDMLLILRSIKKGTSDLFSSIGRLINFSLKNILTISVFMAISVGIGLGIYFIKKPYYTSFLSVSHIRVANDYCYQMINSLNAYFDSNGNAALAEKLGISSRVAREIKDIKYLPLNENIAGRYSDSTTVMLPFKVEVEVYRNDILDPLQAGIMNYLESNEYATKLKNIEWQTLEKTGQRIQKEIVEMDSLKGLVNQGIIPRTNGNGIVFGQPIDPVSVYKRGMELHQQEMLLEKNKKLNNSFEVVVSFTKSMKRSDTSGLFYVITGCIIGYLVGLAYSARRKKPA